MCAKGISRRDFLKASGIATGSLLVPTGMALPVGEASRFPLRKKVGEVTTICTYCAVGCG
ncbi:MAG: twin-arginine translocation signal domain-containing protein, partial [Anaerolineae bacterium]|nr:twin-arginine translocation signal domain-containing protein [Anaerolineae bacterium]NIN97045.1 twin-arginine translocation signal domain-containing protein [Anaerolineae bacterium]